MKTRDYSIPELLETLHIKKINTGVSTGKGWPETHGDVIASVSPNDGKVIAEIKQASSADYESVIHQATTAFQTWRSVPAPRRGEIVRQMGDALRKFKEPLGRLVSYEMGKILQEGLGEVQEMIDVSDFAVGQSRMLYGMTTQSERNEHRMYEQYHPLGPVGVISAFNFPVSVWAWNAMIALICGDTVIWKPSSKVFLCAIAVHHVLEEVLHKNDLPEGIINLVAGNSRDIGDIMLSDRRIPLISATGSTPMGKHAAKLVGERLGRTILELGGNNAIIVTANADLDLAVRATVFGAVGTTGQRCTSTRRLIIHESIFNPFTDKLLKVYQQISKRIGHALNSDTLVGPMIDPMAIKNVQNALKRLKQEGGQVLYGGQVLTGPGYESGCYITPALARVSNEYAVVKEETFGPLLYLIPFKDVTEAIRIQNEVPQGLSSAMFTRSLQDAELFLSARGSDCGIANINIGTSGAEIGGAFGGEKDTGGGRECGSDAWKQYMRRQNNTINYSNQLPLAQGIRFDI